MDMSLDRKAVALLREARLLLAGDPKHGTPRKWTKGSMKNQYGYCAVGAVRQAAGFEPTANESDLQIDKRYPAYRRALSALAKTVRPKSPNSTYEFFYVDDVIGFNDTPTTTWEELEQGFKAAQLSLK